MSREYYIPKEMHSEPEEFLLTSEMHESVHEFTPVSLSTGKKKKKKSAMSKIRKMSYLVAASVSTLSIGFAASSGNADKEKEDSQAYITEITNEAEDENTAIDNSEIENSEIENAAKGSKDE